MKKLSYKTLYIAWAVMFALAAVLGFLAVLVMTDGIRRRTGKQKREQAVAKQESL